MNCWEKMRCMSKESCSAYKMNMGNRCWAAAGTAGGREPQGIFARMSGECRVCDFYKAYGPGIPPASSCCPIR